MKTGKAKVAWKVVCLPKDEGGLGIKRLDVWNKTLMTKHIWNILTHKDSMWVRWIHRYKMRGRSFWEVPLRGDLSWCWRKILNMRDLVRRHFWFRIGRGNMISAWFDIWHSVCPLSSFLPRYAITREYQISDKIADIAVDNLWNWPDSWNSRYPDLLHLPSPNMSNENDKLYWRMLGGELVDFSISQVWESIRPRAERVNWASVVWFPQCIPRHSIHLWLAIGGKLKTQDRLKQWDVGPSIDLNLLLCPLCNSQPDSHPHLFFECDFSSQVWLEVLRFAGYSMQVVRLFDCIQWVNPTAARRSIRSVIFKLILGASSYIIWQERNLRLFKNQKRSKDQVVASITEVVRLRVLSFSFKHSVAVLKAMDIWKIPRSLVRAG